VLERILERLPFRGAKGVKGLNATENNLKMTGAVVGPFLAMWLFIKMFLPDAMYDMAVTISLFAWLAWVVILWAWCRSDAAGFIPFPQSKWKFPDGTCKTFDVKVPPDSWERLADFPDGKIAYKVYFADAFAYQDPDLPYPDIFDMAYWILPCPWDKAFQRRAFGEFFHKGVFVQHPACEDISVYVLDWETKEGERFPVCLINDCSHAYQQSLETFRAPDLSEQGISKAHALMVLYRDGRKREEKLLSHARYLEDRLEISEREASEDFKKSADNRLKAIRGRHARIMDTKPPLITRIFNMKTVATALLVITFVLLVGKLIFHWW